MNKKLKRYIIPILGIFTIFTLAIGEVSNNRTSTEEQGFLLNIRELKEISDIMDIINANYVGEKKINRKKISCVDTILRPVTAPRCSLQLAWLRHPVSAFQKNQPERRFLLLIRLPGSSAAFSRLLNYMQTLLFTMRDPLSPAVHAATSSI